MQLHEITLKLQGLCHEGYSNHNVIMYGHGAVLNIKLEPDVVILEGEECQCGKDTDSLTPE